MSDDERPDAPAALADEHVLKLARLFGEHPAWRSAAALLADEATSAVGFRHRPGEAWRLVRRDGRTELLRGVDPDPDLAFRFTRRSVERLQAVRGGIGDFAVALFELAIDADDEVRVEIRVRAPFRRLLRRGYVTLLLRAGPKVAAFGAAHGVHSLAGLRRIVVEMRGRPREPWEGGS